MVAAKKNRSDRHLQALQTSSALAGYFLEMYRPGAAMVRPKKVIEALNRAKVRYVVMGTHGLSGWRSGSRATQDVDVLVAKRDHKKAVRTLQQEFPKLVVEDSFIVTRFKDPRSGEPRIDVMKPLQKVFQMVFRYTKMVGESHRIPDLEMALVSKFAAMVSPHRKPTRKIQDAADFADMVEHNNKSINRSKLCRLADMVYAGGRLEISRLVDDILAGRVISI